MYRVGAVTTVVVSEAVTGLAPCLGYIPVDAQRVDELSIAGNRGGEGRGTAQNGHASC